MSSKVKVRGQAAVAAEPDDVRLVLDVTALEEAPDRALAEAARRGRELAAVLDEIGIEPRARSTSGLVVREEREYERQRWVRKGFRASSSVTVRIDDAAIIGKLMSEATGRARAEVRGPWWGVKPDNPARAEACRLAATDARRKAEAYAAALGKRLGDVLEVVEPSAPPGYGPGEMVRVASLAAPETEDAPMPVESGELRVTAVVEISFALEDA